MIAPLGWQHGPAATMAPTIIVVPAAATAGARPQAMGLQILKLVFLCAAALATARGLLFLEEALGGAGSLLALCLMACLVGWTRRQAARHRAARAAERARLERADRIRVGRRP
ncbi:hypothetical protein P8C59_007511 [Phyllachora maydis]|uniref:Transmembrane protein n=1 Tax=Phyllachora maydis TaxID=1825666 RepID=A0AAD9MFM7_9PEZI|nr:hypothetical protein P8C59_007511 [Phyllachora maydis]